LAIEIDEAPTHFDELLSTRSGSVGYQVNFDPQMVPLIKQGFKSRSHTGCSCHCTPSVR
jgi:hypothetical protein